MNINTTTLPKSPLTRTIPCRARGVCDSHTPQSAYFEILQDCEHGKILKCSFPACRKSGRLFRYCKECDKVVAKRNFSKRHGHLIVPRSPRCPAEMMTNSDDSASSTTSKKRDSFVDSEGDLHAPVNNSDFIGVNGESTCDACLSTDSSYMLTSSDLNTGAPNPLIPIMVSQTEASLIQLIRPRQNIDETNSLINDMLDESTEDDFLPDGQRDREEPQSCKRLHCSFFDESDIDRIFGSDIMQSVYYYS
jgi:hypothetical protein